MIEPAGHRVLVKADVVQEKTTGGLIMPRSAQEQKQMAQIFGTVTAIGKTAFKAFDDGEAWCELGDRVAFAKYGGFLIKDPETQEEFRLLNDEDICAIIRV